MDFALVSVPKWADVKSVLHDIELILSGNEEADTLMQLKVRR